MKKSNKIWLVLANVIFWLIVLFIGLAYHWDFPPFNSKDGTYYPTMLWGNLFNAIVLYLNALFLFPNRKKLWLPYWLTVLILILSTSIIEAIGDYQLVFQLDLYDQLDSAYKEHPALFIVDYFINNLFMHSFWYILSFTIVFIYESNKNKQIQKALEQEKMKAELDFLRAQINPHFLFNGINSVYFLIDEKPEIAKSTLLKFSDLLRYQLYECKDDSILLSKELSHIESYIEMEHIRRGDDVIIDLKIPESIDAFSISPLLFTPFIENAFKYVSNHDNGLENQISIVFEILENKLKFNIKNTYDSDFKNTTGGIGIENVKKRLNLLYPNKHKLDINKDATYFEVDLIINLN